MRTIKQSERRLISIFVSAILLLCLFPAHAFAADEDRTAPSDDVALNFNKGDGIYTPPTKKDLEEQAASIAEAEKYVMEKEATKGTGGSVKNKVGIEKQNKDYNCGPYAARNAIKGRSDYLKSVGGAALTVPPVGTLATSLGTRSSGASPGTDFQGTWVKTMNTYCPVPKLKGVDVLPYKAKWGPNKPWPIGTTDWNTWSSNMRSLMMLAFDAGLNYNAIANINHPAATSSQYINSYYKTGAGHYVCVFGYNDSSGVYNISESNQNIAATTYTTPYKNLAWSTQKRGIVSRG